MDNWIFVFILNLIGGFLVFVGLNLISGLIEERWTQLYW
ncbi:formate/nitrite transporter FocA (FNT family) [Bacillus luteolus]|nr:formate/nitrite transporter FocA (FNT family) [Cytobacillus luteolus]